MSKPVIELARAKINLTLHVGEVQSDGYHPLSSIVIFADAADIVTAQSADDFSLTIDGPFSKGLSADEDNLILRAARFARGQLGGPKLKFHLTKNLPVSSGIGGGSADAAAAMRHVAAFAGLSVSDLKNTEQIGADIPVCLYSRTSMMQGIGQDVSRMMGQRRHYGVLVNPGLPVSTGKIFQAFDQGPAGDLKQPVHDDLVEAALEGRNDLQPIACDLQPEIVRILMELAVQPGVKLSRMSGSGASCFAITHDMHSALNIKKLLAAKYPLWWIWAGGFGDPS